uniref:Fibulin 5 n=1 Tax=Poecilia reticulata TaxID=8081 RepID=A0A3P9Q385_POERE
MLAALVFTLLCIQSAHGQVTPLTLLHYGLIPTQTLKVPLVSPQPCPYGFEYNRNLGQCSDVNECSWPQPCQGEMLCVNRIGGYQCLSGDYYDRPYRRVSPAQPEPSYPDPSDRIPDTFARTPPRAVEPSYPIVSNPALCTLGYALAADGTCNDIDECETNSHHCNPTQVCINTAGGYTCSCTEGYWLIAGQCQGERIWVDNRLYGVTSAPCLASKPGRVEPASNIPAFPLCSPDVDECEEQPCSHGCFNTYGSFMCNCDEGYELASDGTTCIDLDECSFSEFLCQFRCVNTPGSFSCTCPPGYYLYEDSRSCEDVNECDTGNNTCTTEQVCFNFQGGYTCLNPLQCQPPYLAVSDNQCMCSAENPACRDLAFTVLYRHMDLSSGRSVPADIFQMQATTRYPGAFYIFQIKSGNSGREFYMRVSTQDLASITMHTPQDFRSCLISLCYVFLVT